MVNLFFNYYKDKNRQHEIDLCLEMNRKVFDNVFVIHGRPTFNMLFNLTEQYPNDINVFCNSDIYFPDISLLKNIKEKECYALTRYNKIGDNLKFFDRVDSQDAWVFKGTVKNINADFAMGLWGCDNRLAYEIEKAGYKLSNPSKSIITIHLHEIDNRNQERTKSNTVPLPYKTIQPTSI